MWTSQVGMSAPTCDGYAVAEGDGFVQSLLIGRWNVESRNGRTHRSCPPYLPLAPPYFPHIPSFFPVASPWAPPQGEALYRVTLHMGCANLKFSTSFAHHLNRSLPRFEVTFESTQKATLHVGCANLNFSRHLRFPMPPSIPPSMLLLLPFPPLSTLPSPPQDDF
ncbi:unnamed protein product [Closterium sp. NIES-65]|nr:unnamed protein product [Closterium sp. NIES-65]